MLSFSRSLVSLPHSHLPRKMLRTREAKMYHAFLDRVLL